MLKNYFLLFFLWAHVMQGQLKFLVEDFEGYADGTSDLVKNGVFTFGNTTATIFKSGASSPSQKFDYLGQRAIRISKKSKDVYGGWGKGTSLLVQLDAYADAFCFYAKLKSGKSKKIKILLQEDDNFDNTFKKENDDQWAFVFDLEPGDNWHLVSIPLQKFNDETQGGDGIFNCNYKEGKLLCVLMNFEKEYLLKEREALDLDFICFTKGGLQQEGKKEGCFLGLWSAEGNKANFTEIATNFEQMFGSEKKLSVIHFFQPFSADGTDKVSQYPSVDRVNKIIEQGYIPMITLENHYVNVNSKTKQPNLYSIIEGHMDGFFVKWADDVKQMKGTVWVRILHEFNGNWYPWCVSQNDQNPALFIKAYKHIHDIFTNHGADNVKFIWCPNSMSVPQTPWNFIMDAYPGDEYVDLVGMDVYNGASDDGLWRSFRKEATENYFLFTQQLPSKPVIICETASRERSVTEATPSQTKAEWIRQQSETLQSDMTQIKLLTWFNEKSTFKINSSAGAKKSYLENIIQQNYFKSGGQGANEISEIRK